MGAVGGCLSTDDTKIRLIEHESSLMGVVGIHLHKMHSLWSLHETQF